MRDAHAARLSTPGVTRRLGAWSRLSLGAKVSLVVLLLIALSALFAPLLAPHDPTAIDFKGQSPNSTFWFGTDNLGRDVFSRLLYGGRYSLAVGLLATLVALAFGIIFGSIAAVSNKWVSEIIMRAMDVIMSVPGIALVAVTVVVFRDPQRPVYMLGVITCSIALVYIPQLTRIVRANILTEYGKDYVNAVVVSGARTPWILAKHVARNCAATVLVFATVLVAGAIILEASLTFIGAGLQEPTPTWGNILSSAQQGVLRGDWWQALFPGLLIMATVLCLNILSEGMTDAMVVTQTKSSPSQAPREEDELLVDPVRAYRVQHEALVDKLDALSRTEATRTDRLRPAPEAQPVLEVRDLSIRFPRHGDVNVVDHVSFGVAAGETMGIVGESGCGKSITNLAIMGLLDRDAHVEGQILYKGADLLALPKDQHRALLGRDIAMVYQDALSALNPSMLIRSQIKQLTDRGGTRTAEELLQLVGLDPKRTLDSYPHELSGGQRQRVLIAMALTRDPEVVIADEPTTALDVTVQQQVVQLLLDLQTELGFALIFVSHDLALVSQVAHSITVMYAGQIVEQGATEEVLSDPRHEYTRGLLGAVLSIEDGTSRLHQVPGQVPTPAEFPQGDRFAPRSSHPSVGLTTPPVKRFVPGTMHYYYDLPDELHEAAELERAGQLDGPPRTDEEYAALETGEKTS